jgi:hypothetical protein
MENQTVIDTIVKYSKECIILRFIKNHTETNLRLLKSLPIRYALPSVDTIKIPLEELQLKIDEVEKDIGRLIEPLFEGHDFGHTNSAKHSLTIKEIKQGYILLDGEEYIIMLRPFVSKSTGYSYTPGVLYKIGSGVRQEDLDSIPESEEPWMKDDILRLIINKKTAYEYLK